MYKFNLFHLRLLEKLKEYCFLLKKTNLFLGGENTK